MTSTRLEVCVDTFEGAKTAAENGADRIELCSSLLDGGLTPSTGFQRISLSLNVPIYVMLRPRGGDFVYSDEEKAIILEDAREAGRNKVHGIAVGAVTSEGRLDVPFLKEVLAAANLPATLHRAFDTLHDPFVGLEDAVETGFERILTSGQTERAETGSDLIRALVEKAGNRISIMPGSGVTLENVGRILEQTGAHEVHTSCSSRNLAHAADSLPVRLGFTPKNGEKITDAGLVHQMVSAIRPEQRAVS